MKRHHGGEKVNPGLYFNLHELAFASVDEAGPLPGPSTTEYWRVPAVAMLIVGPLMGLAYALFLPFIGLAMIATALGRKAGEMARDAAVASARVLEPAWSPAAAFLARRRRKPRREKAGRDEWVEAVEAELGEDGREAR